MRKTEPEHATIRPASRPGMVHLSVNWMTSMDCVLEIKAILDKADQDAKAARRAKRKAERERPAPTRATGYEKSV